MLDIDKSVEKVLGDYAAAVNAKDVAALARLYDPKVRVFDAWGIWSYDGREAWQLAMESWLTSLGTERVKVTFDDVLTSGNAECVIASAIVTYASLSAEGAQLRAMQNRMTWGLRTSGHVLRIIHEHTSAPMGFEDMKAILVREPQP